MDDQNSGSIDPMKNDHARLKKLTMEPKVYALVVKSTEMAILHVGVYYSLDEAFAAVKRRAIAESKSKDANKLNLEMWMWEAIPPDYILKRFFGSETPMDLLVTKDLSTVEESKKSLSTAEYVKQVTGMKNELMKRIIDNKDLKALEESKSFMSEAELKLIRSKILPKKTR